ncbi:MAG: hypothetical protein KBD78_07770 [Oligoflexales bacterium]|nr:hypothetical protein [Oligoflexales bacterium]
MKKKPTAPAAVPSSGNTKVSEDKYIEFRKNEKNLSINMGNDFRLVKEKFPEFFIVHICSSSMMNDGHDETFFIYFDPKTSTVSFNLMTVDHKFHHIASEKFDLLSPEGTGINCYSHNEAKRLNTTIQNSEGMAGQIIPISTLDLFCYQLEEGFARCYGYNEKTKEWTRVGGWHY